MYFLFTASAGEFLSMETDWMILINVNDYEERACEMTVIRFEKCNRKYRVSRKARVYILPTISQQNSVSGIFCRGQAILVTMNHLAKRRTF